MGDKPVRESGTTPRTVGLGLQVQSRRSLPWFAQAGKIDNDAAERR